jgi:hypothetical protein
MDMHRGKEFLVSGRLLVADAPDQMVRLLNAVNGYPLAELSVQMCVTLPLASNDTRTSATTTGQECILGTNLATTDTGGEFGNARDHASNTAQVMQAGWSGAGSRGNQVGGRDFTTGRREAYAPPRRGQWSAMTASRSVGVEMTGNSPAAGTD